MDFEPFNQAPPELGNQFDDDRALRSYLTRVVPADVLAEWTPSLREMGELAGGELYRMQLEDRANEPVLTSHDPWGERIDEIRLTRVWDRAKTIAAEKGIVATAYEKKHEHLSRVHQFALAYLFAPSTDVYACPLAMTDGAAHTLVELESRRLCDRALPRLTSRDPERLWTSGQWMTESTGGSDVGTSETVAEKDGEGRWRLWGRKYFTSAATSEVALTLGRPQGNESGGRGLALFYVETRDERGRLQNIEVNRLKDKLGTRKVPTAEIMLRGVRAELVAGDRDGVKNITPMLTITRTWNSVTAAAGMRRGLALALDFAQRRVAFGAPLSEKPLHLETLADLAAETEGALQISFLVAELLGRHENGVITEHEARLLRMLTPLAKLTTGKQAVVVASEVLECFGGAGYVEDTGLPVLLRDAQVLPIWEGTTNVLSLDVLRAMSRDQAALVAVQTEVETCASEAKDSSLAPAGQLAVDTVRRCAAWVREAMDEGPAALEGGARRFALTLGRAVELALLVRQAQSSLDVGDPRPAAAARRFAESRIVHLAPTDPNDVRALVG
jgi:alkylation response protein AidB-like acyl-CoA dehydrogenase